MGDYIDDNDNYKYVVRQLRMHFTPGDHIESCLIFNSPCSTFSYQN